MYPAREIAERESYGLVGLRAPEPGVGEIVFRDGSVVRTGLCWSEAAERGDIVQMAGLMRRWTEYRPKEAIGFLLRYGWDHVGNVFTATR